MATRRPKIMNWVRGRGGGRPDDVVAVYVYGPTRRSDEGAVGHDMRVRPTRLGPGQYTMVVAPDDLEPVRERDRQTAQRDSLSTGVAREIVEGMIDGFWLRAWADAAEERDERLPDNITRETAPPAPRAARTLARKFASITEKMSRASLAQLYERASRAEGARVNPRELGSDLAMESQGSGVSWTDDHEGFDISFPSSEVHAYRHGGRWVIQGSISERFPNTLRDPARRARSARKGVRRRSR